MLLATHEMGFAKEVASKVCFLRRAASSTRKARRSGSSGTRRASGRAAFLKRIIEAGRFSAGDGRRL